MIDRLRAAGEGWREALRLGPQRVTRRPPEFEVRSALITKIHATPKLIVGKISRRIK